MSTKFVFQAVVLAVMAVGVCTAQTQCDPPTEGQLADVIARIISGGDNSAGVTVDLMEFRIICSAFGMLEGRLRQVSVVVDYTCTGNSVVLTLYISTACDSSCVGLMRCYGLTSSQCCNYYDNSECLASCPPGFIPGLDDYICFQGELITMFIVHSSFL